MHDSYLLAACMTDRKAYDRVSRYVDVNEFSPMAGFWWKLVVDWYSRSDGGKSIDRSVLRERGNRKVSEKHREAILGWFDNLPDDVSPDNAAVELLELKRYVKGNELAASLYEGHDKVLPIAREYVELLEAEDIGGDTWVEAGTWDEIDEQLSDQNRIKLLPLELNRRAGGGATPGDHLIIFGATEIGKSLFTINMVCGFLRQGQRVLYVSNEDAARKVKDRVRSNLSHMTTQEARGNAQATAKAIEKGANNLFVGNMDPGDVVQIERKVEEYDAQIIVVDQIRNLHSIHGKSNAGITQRMDQAAQEIRSLLIRKQLIGVSIAQAGAGEHGKMTVYYHADDIDSSRVGLSAQGDLVIGIGANEEMLDRDERYISICKNKLGDTKEGFITTFDERRSKCPKMR